MMNEPWSIPNGLKIINEFKSEPRPDFTDGTQDACPYIIWNLYNRAFEAIKSVGILIQQARYYDAFVIAGHALETCSILSYIKDNEKKTQECYEKYMARSAVARLIAILEMSKNLSNDISWFTYSQLLKMLCPYGKRIFRKLKDSNLDYQGVLEKLCFRLGDNSDKIRMLKEYFISPCINNYINNFRKNIDNLDDEQFKFFYTKYCNLKHVNLMTPGACDEDISTEDGENTLLLVLGLILYLQTSGLNPYKSEKLIS